MSRISSYLDVGSTMQEQIANTPMLLKDEHRYQQGAVTQSAGSKISRANQRGRGTARVTAFTTMSLEQRS